MEKIKYQKDYFGTGNFLFVPLAYLFSRFGLEYFWLTYPVTDTTVSVLGYMLSRRFFKSCNRIIPVKE